MSSSSRASKRSMLDTLKLLRDSKRTRLHDYKVEEDTDIFVEVDDDEYDKQLQDRYENDDFVVDDHGEGYVEGAAGEWDNNEDGYGSSGSDGRSKRKVKGAAKDKVKANSNAREQQGSIGKYLSNINTRKPQKTSNVNDQSFLDDLLQKFDDEPERTEHKGDTVESPRVRSEIKRRPAASSGKGKADENEELQQITDKAESLHLRNRIQSSPTPALQLTSSGDDTSDMMVMMEDDDFNNESKPAYVTSKAISQERHGSDEASIDMNDEEDLMVKPITGFSKAKDAAVYTSSLRPTAKALQLEDALDASSWRNITAGLKVAKTDENFMPSKVSPGDIIEEDGTLRFFWIDFAEIGGSLCLFGKSRLKGSKLFVSVFLKVDGLLRKLYFLPREHRWKHGRDVGEDIEMSDVYDEVDTLLSQRGIKNWKSKPCARKYAFELPGIPPESDYLKVLYSYDKPALPLETSGETFSQIFGTNTALFEQFVLAINIMGPCWLEIKCPNFGAIENASWCKVEVQVDSPSHVSVLPESNAPEIPTLTLMSVTARTKLNFKDNKQEIVIISGRVYNNVPMESSAPAEELPCQTFTILRPYNKNFPPGFEKESTQHKGLRLEKYENGLLSSFLAKLQMCDPDILIGHQMEDFVHSTLLHRLKECKTHSWHRVGRMKRSQWPSHLGRGAMFAERQLFSGRLVCDLANDLGKSLMNKCQSWSLTEMCDLILAKKRIDIDTEAALKQWTQTGRGFLDLIEHCETDTYFVAAIAMNVQIIPLAKQLTNLAGNSWARTMSGTRAERNEYILLHEFSRNKYICPDKTYDKGKGNDSKEVDDNTLKEESQKMIKKKSSKEDWS